LAAIKASAAAKMKIAPGNLGILHSVRFTAADKQFRTTEC
jgi:hypothetical protein